MYRQRNQSNYSFRFHTWSSQISVRSNQMSVWSILAQSIGQTEPIRESVFVEHSSGWLINIHQQAALRCAIIHRRIARDKRVLHNAACNSLQEQSGAPPRVSLPILRVSSWLMCNWLDEWVSHSGNPSKYCLIKHPLCLLIKKLARSA